MNLRKKNYNLDLYQASNHFRENYQTNNWILTFDLDEQKKFAPRKNCKNPIKIKKNKTKNFNFS